MVSEGKNEDEPNIARIMHQCWVQASYCFESYEGLTKLHILAWEGRNREMYRMSKGHRKVMSANTDPGYTDLAAQGLPSSLKKPMKRGSVNSFEKLDELIDVISECLRP